MNNQDALLAANADYYRAFAERDLDAMSALWAPDHVSCVHPGWPALTTHSAIVASYRDIFRNPRQETVTSRDETVLISGADGRVFCVETVGGGLLLATNWFMRIDGEWRLVHHQASPLIGAREPRQSPSKSLH